jgi:serine phosphatase RsbU (regulator of sigma subunit)
VIKLSSLILLFSFLGLSTSFSQNFGDPNFYLIDSLDLDQIETDEKHHIDSCLTVFHESKNDTIQAMATLQLTSGLSDLNNVERYAYWMRDFTNERIEVNKNQKEVKYLKSVLGESYFLIAYCEGNKGKYRESITNYQKSADLFGELDLRKDEAMLLSNIGSIYDDIGDIQNCLDYYHKSLKIKLELKDSIGIGNSYNNIGYVYAEQENYQKALEYHKKALEIRTLIGDQKGIANSKNNIALYHSNQGEEIKAIEIYRESLKIRLELELWSETSNSYRNIAWCFWQLDEQDSAIHQINLAIEYANLSKSRKAISHTNSSLGAFYVGMNEYEKALPVSMKAYKIADEFGSPDLIRRATKNLYLIYEHKGDYKNAFEKYKTYILMRDSIENKESYRISLKAASQYEYELKEAELEKEQALKDAEHLKEIELEKERKEKQKTISYFAMGGLVLLAAFLAFVFNRLKITRKQKTEIDDKNRELEKTHQQLEEHHKEISDSIIYAQRIQEAILPSKKHMKAHLENGFVYYVPKDVVAGDFYWMEVVNDIVYFAAADCTGHGVPGAMVSVVCSNALSKSVVEEKNLNTGKLLDRTRELVIERFAKSGEELKDGMDISLCALNTKTNELQWSGANNPLWILRKGELIETKADKQPIGSFSKATPFNAHDIKLEKDDALYIFTDGLQDQFGGEKGKKFKPKKIREFLLENQHLEMDEQQHQLHELFLSWMGDLEQVDDICMIGVKIS